MTNALENLVLGFAWFSLAYFLVLNTTYLVLIMLAAFDSIDAARGATFAGHDDIFHSPLAPPITIIVPARNEAMTIVGCVGGLLHLRYPEFEVVVIDDGSDDQTFERLRDAFDLVEIPRVIRDDLPIVGLVMSTHSPRDRTDLLVVRKESIGRPADAVNLGINAARNPLVCRVDADSYLDDDALLAVAKPFVEDPQNVVAAGAAIRVANGSKVYEGRVVDAHAPPGWLARIQAVEYLRAFLLGRAGWSRLHGLLFVSGAFGLFRRDLLVEIGGMDTGSEGDDVELVLRLQHHLRRARRRYRVAFVARSCCWTQVPSTYSVLARQRRRWGQILAEALWAHRTMFVNPRYGFMGLVVLPYYLVFELLGAVVELAAFPVFILGMALGTVEPSLTLLFVVIGFGYAAFLSIMALAIEELAYPRYRGWRDLWLMFLAAILENLGYRQMYAWWRLRGVARAARGHPATWLPESTATAA